MGIWGDKVFDSDNACDFIGDVIDSLEAVVDDGLDLGASGRRKHFRAALVKGSTLSLDGPVVPAVAALRALLIGVRPARFCIGKGKVRRWRRAYFEWFEREFVPANGPSVAYRKHIEREFNGLLRLAEGEDPDEEDDADPKG